MPKHHWETKRTVGCIVCPQQGEDLLYNAEKFYDDFQDAIKDGEQNISFEIIAECSRNQRLRKEMYEQRIKILGIVSEYLNLQIKRGFFKKDMDLNAIAYGLISLYDGAILKQNDRNKQ